MSQTTWTSFGPDPPLSTLDVTAQQCLAPNGASAACDAYIGSAAAGNGFCSLPTYKTTTYCACVNNAIPCPQNAMASCANAAYSYKLWQWTQTPSGGGLSHNATCATSPICVNLVEVGGNQNVVSGITQQCGTITNITNVLKTNPALAVLTFLLFITLIVVMSLHADSDGGKRSTPPPPPPGMFDGPAAAGFPF